VAIYKKSFYWPIEKAYFICVQLNFAIFSQDVSEDWKFTVSDLLMDCFGVVAISSAVGTSCRFVTIAEPCRDLAGVLGTVLLNMPDGMFVYKKSNLGIFWRVFECKNSFILWSFGIFLVHLVYLVVIWYILRSLWNILRSF
jgi:hypothetical protein